MFPFPLHVLIILGEAREKVPQLVNRGRQQSHNSLERGLVGRRGVRTSRDKLLCALETLCKSSGILGGKGLFKLDEVFLFFFLHVLRQVCPNGAEEGLEGSVPRIQALELVQLLLDLCFVYVVKRRKRGGRWIIIFWFGQN